MNYPIKPNFKPYYKKMDEPSAPYYPMIVPPTPAGTPVFNAPNPRNLKKTMNHQ